MHANESFSITIKVRASELDNLAYEHYSRWIPRSCNYFDVQTNSHENKKFEHDDFNSCKLIRRPGKLTVLEHVLMHHSSCHAGSPVSFVAAAKHIVLNSVVFRISANKILAEGLAAVPKDVIKSWS